MIFIIAFLILEFVLTLIFVKVFSDINGFYRNVTFILALHIIWIAIVFKYNEIFDYLMLSNNRFKINIGMCSLTMFLQVLSNLIICIFK
ncbi:MAG: hypothetical protein NTW25_14695 [Candidatus Kapabacteria bacterium]|nr:hypothetical protein [Candidatus Kapabacteria bacterium]